MAPKSDIFVAIAFGVQLLACSSHPLSGSGRAGAGGSGGGGTGGSAGSVAGTGGAGGGGGTVAGTGGSGGGLPTFEPRATASDCSAVLNTAAGPLLLDALVTCSQTTDGAGVAAGAGDRGLVFFSGYNTTRLVTVEPDGAISAIRGPTPAAYLRLLSDGNGEAYVQAERRSGTGPGFYRLDAQGWWLEPINPALATAQIVVVGRARFAGDGRAYVPYHQYDGMLTLATRDAPGSWGLTSISAPDTPFSFDAATDSQGRPHVVLLTWSALASDPRVRVSDWIAGDASPTAVLGPITDVRPSDVRDAPSAASTTQGLVAIAVATLGGIHVVYERASGPTTDMVVPDTRFLEVTGCPPLPANGGPASTPCHEMGDGVVMQVLARTSGALWLVYFWLHVDIDKVQSLLSVRELVNLRGTDERRSIDGRNRRPAPAARRRDGATASSGARRPPARRPEARSRWTARRPGSTSRYLLSDRARACDAALRDARREQAVTAG